MSKFKRIISLLLVSILLVSCAPKANAPANGNGNATTNEASQPAEDNKTVAELPKPSDTEGDYSADKSNINTENLIDFLNRDDSVYIDLRDYEDYVKKHFRNFEVIPFFAYIFNEKAGEEGFPQLYKGTHEEPVAVYESSDAILNALFPKDKNLIIVCQSGGRVTMLMKMLAAKGYDMSKVYNVGGMAQYTDEKYREFITDTEELNVESTYTINANKVN